MGLQVINSKEEFEEVLEKNKDKVVVVDFYANWCGPCRVIGPKLEPMAKDLNVVIVKVDCDEQSELVEEKKVEALPTFIIYKNGNEVERVIGANAEQLKGKIEIFSKGC